MCVCNKDFLFDMYTIKFKDHDTDSTHQHEHLVEAAAPVIKVTWFVTKTTAKKKMKI